MGSVTAKGYPYPVGTDRVSDGDNAIQALATAADTIAGAGASGVVSVVLSSQTNAATAVTFPVGRFTVAPSMCASSTNSLYFASVNPATTAAAGTVYLRHHANTSTSATVPCHWIARQE